jgi:2-dehydropantoate 2-reductase
VSIAVFGAGAVGAFFGGLLVRGGQEVSFIARGAQLDALRTDGIRIHSLLLGEVLVPRVRAYERAADAGIVDLVLVCVKANQTAEVLDDLAALVGPATSIVTLQNGIESDDVISSRFGRACVLPAVVYVGATVDRPGEVTHVAAGTIIIGSRSEGLDARLAAVRDMLAASGQPVRVSPDIQYERWQKLIWNAGFNTVSAITGRTPRDLVSQSETRAIVTGIMREVVSVARASGVMLQESDIEPQLAWTDRAPAIRTSMMVDRERHRAMEVEALIGVIVRRGREHGVLTPVSETIYGLLKGMEAEPSEVRDAAWIPPPRHS